MVAQLDFRKNLGITSNVICARLGMEGYFFIKEAGFDCVDFNLQGGFFDPDALEFRSDLEKILAEHKNAIKSADLKISQTHAPYYFLDKHLKNSKDFEKYLSCVKESIDITSDLETKCLVLHPFFLTKALEALQIEQMEFNLKHIGDLANYAQRKNISIALENLPYDFCNDASSHQHLINSVNRSNVVACLDTGHALIVEGEQIVGHATQMSNLIRVVHIHDNDGRNDIHWHVNPQKKIWLEIIRSLLANENLKTLSLETSGVYKNCCAEDIPAKLVEDFSLITKLLHEAQKNFHDTF